MESYLFLCLFFLSQGLEKYGLRDRWVGLFVDAAGTVPVRLIPLADIPAGAADGDG